jgi:hypothetical protein
MFDRISASFELAKSSWAVLRKDKQLIIFPILSGVACFLVLLSFALPFVFNPQWLLALDDNAAARGFHLPWWTWVVLFAFYFCNYFVVAFFNAALISCALIRFNGGTPTVSDGLQAAASRMPQLLAWALVSATVGTILKVIENASDKAGQFITGLLGVAWTIMTYFVVPVLVVEKVGPFEAVKRSMAILRRTWGEALVGRMGIGFFLFLLMLPAVALFVVGGAVFAAVPAIGLLVFAAAVLYLVGVAVVGAALQGIFVGALYQYAAHGEVPRGFDHGTMEQAFAPKNA